MKHILSFTVFESLSNIERRIEYLQNRIDRYKASKSIGTNIDSEEQIKKLREELKKLRVMKKKQADETKKRDKRQKEQGYKE